MEIVRKLLTAAEVTPPNLRYNVDCDCVQTSPDGGVTWIDSPGSDPRTAPQYQMPGISTSDPACDGAARIAAALKRSIDTVVATSNAVQLASALLDVFLFIVPVIGIIAEAIYIAAVALLAIGTAAIELAFTSDVYDQIQCLALCYLGDDGQFTADDWESFQSACFDHFGVGTVSDVLQINFDTLGMVGFNNAVSTGTETGDCSDCASCAPVELAIWNDGSFTYGADLVDEGDGWWHASSVFDGSGNVWCMLYGVDPARLYSVPGADVSFLVGDNDGGDKWVGTWTTEPNHDAYEHGDFTTDTNFNEFGLSKAVGLGPVAFTVRFLIV